MAKIQITEKDDKELIEEWYSDATEQTPETVGEFINHLINDYVHDYGTIAHAVAASAVAGAWAGNRAGANITGFQAGAVTLEFMQRWGSFETPFKVVSYGHLLYPQYDNQFVGMQINKSVLKSLQKMAQEKLDNIEDVEYMRPHPDVKQRWEDFVEGKFPDFLIITEE